MVRDGLARLQVNRVASAGGGRDGSHAVCVKLILSLEFGVVVHTRFDGVVVQARGLGNLLAGSKAHGVASASRRGNRSDAVCVLSLEFRVIVYTRFDVVAVQSGGFRNLLASSKAYGVAGAFGCGNGVDREGLLVLAAERRRSLRESAGDILLVFDGLDASDILFVLKRSGAGDILLEGLGAGKSSGATEGQWVSCAAMRVLQQCLRCFGTGGRHGGGC